MKRIISIAAALTLLTLALASCGGAADKGTGDTAGTGGGTSAAPVRIDIDLTDKSAQIVYAYVYNMMTEPDDYLGKVLRVKGTYDVSYYEPTDNYYHWCVIADATACCAQGLEFICSAEDAYPEEGSEITIEGTFGKYDELGYTYYYIAADKLTVG